MKINPDYQYQSYDWNRNGLFILGISEKSDVCKVWNYDSSLVSQ